MPIALNRSGEHLLHERRVALVGDLDVAELAVLLELLDVGLDLLR